MVVGWTGKVSEWVSGWVGGPLLNPESEFNSMFDSVGYRGRRNPGLFR